jgi:hypothetical protein
MNLQKIVLGTDHAGNRKKQQDMKDKPGQLTSFEVIPHNNVLVM